MAFQQYNLYKKLTTKSKILVMVHHWLNYEKEVEGIVNDCQHIICVSSQYRNLLLDRNVLPNKVDLILNGIEDRFYKNINLYIARIKNYKYRFLC